MAKYIRSETTATAGGASTDITGSLGLAQHDVVEVGCDEVAGAWVNYKGGTASDGGADCIHVPASTAVVLVLDQSGLTAIREDATEANVTVSVLGGHP